MSETNQDNRTAVDRIVMPQCPRCKQQMSELFQGDGHLHCVPCWLGMSSLPRLPDGCTVLDDGRVVPFRSNWKSA